MKKIIILLLFISANISADSLTVFSGTSYIEDTYLREDLPDSNQSTETFFRVYGTLFNNYRGLIRLKNITDSIPSNSSIAACTLEVYVYTYNTDATPYYYKLCGPGDWVNSSVTWNDYDGTNSWNAAGLNSASGDNCDACVSSIDRSSTSFSLPTITATGTYKIPIENCMVENWLDGTDGENGIAIFISNSDCRFYSMEAGSAFSPIWKIWWNPASGVSNVRHSPEGNGIRHSVDGASVRHGG